MVLLKPIAWDGGFILGEGILFLDIKYLLDSTFCLFLVDEITKPKTVQNLNRKTKDN